MYKTVTHFLFAVLLAFCANHVWAGENSTQETPLLIAQKDEVYEKYCSAAIEANDANAQFALGLFYASGNAAKQDKHLAALMFYLAAEQQHPTALDWLMQVDGDPSLAELPTCRQHKHLRRQQTA